MTQENNLGTPFSGVEWGALVVGAALAALILLSLPMFLPSGVVFVVGVAACASVLALSFNLMFGYGGLITFAHATLFAVGTYTMAILIRGGAGFWTGMGSAAVMGATIGLVFGLLSLRASGIYFSIITLALGQIIFVVLEQWTSVTGGVSGLPGVRVTEVEFFGVVVSLSASLGYYRFAMLMCVALAVGLWVISRSRLTRRLMAVRDDETRALFLGVNAYRTKLLAFVISSTFSAMAGALYGPLAGLAFPELARWDASAVPILATLLGGARAFIGPVLGSIVFAALDFFTRDLHSLRILVTGLVLLAVLVLLPGGFTDWRANAQRLRAISARFSRHWGEGASK